MVLAAANLLMQSLSTHGRGHALVSDVRVLGRRVNVLSWLQALRYIINSEFGGGSVSGSRPQTHRSAWKDDGVASGMPMSPRDHRAVVDHDSKVSRLVSAQESGRFCVCSNGFRTHTRISWITLSSKSD